MPDFRMLIIHVLNVAILYVILRYLLYKPVAKFMAQRTKRLEDEKTRVEQLQQEAEAITSDSQGILQQARDESRTLLNESATKAKQDADEILRHAEEKAAEIMAQARADSEHEMQAMNEELKAQVGELAIRIAGEVLKREVKAEDNTMVIDAFFGEGEAS